MELLRSDITEIVEGLGRDAQAFAGKTVLMCGARGFLGRYFLETFKQLNEHVLRKPVKILAVDNLITAGPGGASLAPIPHVKFIKHDVIKPLELRQRIAFVIHAAGIASPYYYRAHPLETLEVATAGTKNLLEVARKNQARFLFFSSSEIYGDPDPKYVPTPESYRGNVSCHGPRACYDESKRLGETLCYVYHQKFGTSTNMVRPFNVYGPGMQETDYRVLPNFASRIKGDRPLKVYGSGSQTRTFCYVNDALVGFLKVLLLGAPGEAYNIGNPKPEISMVELVKMTEKVLGRPVKHNVVEYPDSYPADEPNRRCPDITKARLQLGYQPRVSLPEGLKRFFRWADSVYKGDLSP
ncbi:MAG: NAD-dependent epimerase/dehydratase family protein [Elusimicrobia bacterium]|nr:NAD-dependent epimerase/dehydratase family protein [Elusimicrobiota bacterium]